MKVDPQTTRRDAETRPGGSRFSAVAEQLYRIVGDSWAPGQAFPLPYRIYTHPRL